MCPNCGLLVSADMPACQCGYVFGSAAKTSIAAARLRETVDLFSAREALSIAFQFIQELKGGVVRWMAVIGVLQVLPLALSTQATLLPAMLLQLWAGLCVQRAALRAVRGEPAGFVEARVGIGVFGRVLFAWFVMAVPILIGLFLFIAPGIYLSLTWSQAPLLILDGRARHVDSLRGSEELTRDRRIEILMAIALPLVLAVPAALYQAAVPMGGSVATPGFVLFLVACLWQMLVSTFSTFVSVVVYQMLLNSQKHRQP